MKFAAVAFLLCAIGANAAKASKDHPIVKVIDLLKGLKAKAIAEGQQEEVAYGKFQYWCSTSIAELNDAIAAEKEKIDELEDKLAGLQKKKESLEAEIADLEEQIAQIEAEQLAAKKKRDDEAALYKKANMDLGMTIKAVDECIKELEKAEAETEADQHLLLAQHRVKMVLSLVSFKATEEQREALEAFARSEPEAPAPDSKDRPDLKAEGDRKKHIDKYDFKSENVVELLKELRLKFQDDKHDLTVAETNAINAYDMATEARNNAKKAANKSKSKKEKELSETEAAIAEANAELKSTQEDLAADSASLKDTTDACNVKKSEWEERSKTRSLEVEAIEEAVKILSKSSGVRDEAPSNPVPPTSPVEYESPSFLQLQQSPSNDAKQKVIALIREAGKAGDTKAMERLAVAVAAHLKQAPGTRKQGEAIGMNAFSEVNNMIEQMIFRLMNEQKQEDDHKNWCDKELAMTDEMISDKKDKIAEQTAEINLQKGKVAQLTEDIKDAEGMIADIVKFMAEATEIREVGKKENDLSLKDSKQAQESLTNAIAVLEAFYKESGEIPKEPWEFIQKAPVELSEKPSTWDSSYTAVADPTKQPTGIISVLEAVLDDYEKMEAEIVAQEAEDQKEYEQAMKANKIEKAEREQEVEMKTSEKARRVNKIASVEKERKGVAAELEKTEIYLNDLQKPCVSADSTYDDRKAARDQEIVALQKAQHILLDAFKEDPKESELLQKKFLDIKQHKA